MYCKRAKLAMLLLGVSLLILLTSCQQPVHDAVYEELTTSTPQQMRLVNIVATGDSIPQSDGDSSYVTIIAEGSDFLTWVRNDTTPVSCLPPRPPCMQFALDGRLPLSGRDSIYALTSFFPDTSFLRGGHTVEVMERAAPPNLQGSLYSIIEIRPGERLYSMRVR